MQLEPRLDAVARHMLDALCPLYDAMVNGTDDDTRQQARAAVAALWGQLGPDDHHTLYRWMHHWHDDRAERVGAAMTEHPHFDELSPDDQNRLLAWVFWVTFPRHRY